MSVSACPWVGGVSGGCAGTGYRDASGHGCGSPRGGYGEGAGTGGRDASGHGCGSFVGCGDDGGTGGGWGQGDLRDGK